MLARRHSNPPAASRGRRDVRQCTEYARGRHNSSATPGLQSLRTGNAESPSLAKDIARAQEIYDTQYRRLSSTSYLQHLEQSVSQLRESKNSPPVLKRGICLALSHVAHFVEDKDSSITTTITGLTQLAVFDIVCKSFGIPRSSIKVYDPWFTDADRAFLRKFGFAEADRSEFGDNLDPKMPALDEPTLVFHPNLILPTLFLANFSPKNLANLVWLTGNQRSLSTLFGKRVTEGTRRWAVVDQRISAIFEPSKRSAMIASTYAMPTYHVHVHCKCQKASCPELARILDAESWKAGEQRLVDYGLSSAANTLYWWLKTTLDSLPPRFWQAKDKVYVRAISSTETESVLNFARSLAFRRSKLGRCDSASAVQSVSRDPRKVEALRRARHDSSATRDMYKLRLGDARHTGIASDVLEAQELFNIQYRHLLNIGYLRRLQKCIVQMKRQQPSLPMPKRGICLALSHVAQSEKSGLDEDSTYARTRGLLQLVVFDTICRAFTLSRSNVTVYDPVFTQADRAFLTNLGFQAPKDGFGKKEIPALKEPTIYFHPGLVVSELFTANFSATSLSNLIWLGDREDCSFSEIPGRAAHFGKNVALVDSQIAAKYESAKRSANIASVVELPTTRRRLDRQRKQTACSDPSDQDFHTSGLNEEVNSLYWWPSKRLQALPPQFWQVDEKMRIRTW